MIIIDLRALIAVVAIVLGLVVTSALSGAAIALVWRDNRFETSLEECNANVAESREGMQSASRALDAALCMMGRCEK